jgi:hypothetical protein
MRVRLKRLDLVYVRVKEEHWPQRRCDYPRQEIVRLTFAYTGSSAVYQLVTDNSVEHREISEASHIVSMASKAMPRAQVVLEHLAVTAPLSSFS